MRNGDPNQGQDLPDGDERWNVTLDEDFVKAAPVKEEQLHRPGGEPPLKRVWPRNLGLALGAAALTVGAFQLFRPAPDQTGAGAGPVTSPVPSASVSPTASASSALTSARPPISLSQAFPLEVKGASGIVYTRVGATVMTSCVRPDSVGPRLIAMIESSKGCLSEQIALYKDAQQDQFNLAMFTMKDPQDTVRLVTELSMAFDDYEVGAQAPPPGSGLRTLPADSSLVQAFSGSGRSMIAALGQWSDGRGADRQALVDRLTPLQLAVGKIVFAYEAKR